MVSIALMRIQSVFLLKDRLSHCVGLDLDVNNLSNRLSKLENLSQPLNCIYFNAFNFFCFMFSIHEKQTAYLNILKTLLSVKIEKHFE
jgi:hypothetical protein